MTTEMQPAIKTRLSQYPVMSDLLDRVLVNGTPDERALTEYMIRAWKRCYKQVGLTPLLPILFNLKGKPYNLKEHFPMEPMFKLFDIPREILFKCGRQVSKTLAVGGKGQIYLSNGLPVRGETLRRGDKVLSFNEATGSPESGLVIDLHRVDQKECVRITTRMGIVFDAALTHPFKTPVGYRTVSELKVGDNLASLRLGAKFGLLDVEEARVAITAFMIGDGCCRRGSISFTGLPGEAVESFKHYAEQAGNHISISHKKNSPALSLRMKANDPIIRWLKEDRLLDKYSYEKSMPSWVFDLPEKLARVFVECLWATDGMAKRRTNGYNISYCSTSRNLVYQLRSLLLKWGVVSTISKRPSSYKNKEGARVPCRDSYRLRVEGRRSQETFITTFSVPDKPLDINTELKPENNNRDTLPIEANDIVYRLCNQIAYDRDGRTLRQAGLRRKPKYRLSRVKAREYIDYLKEKGVDPSDLVKLIDEQIVWDKIVSIEPIGKHDCWDVEVKTYHNYAVEGVIAHNSTCLAYQGLGSSMVTPYFNTLYVTPLYEQIRRFSHNYMKQALDTCRVRDKIREGGSSENILQRTLSNQSTLFFSFAFTDCERTRGINSDAVKFDEVQGINHDFIPVIKQSTKASEYRLFQYSGTPLTKDNTIEKLWQDSSQAVWVIRCEACGKHNRAFYDGDIMKMLGKKGLICAKCGKPIHTELGYWEHQRPEVRNRFSGYHAPQPIFPMHCRDIERWAELLREMRNETVFMNEVLGESWDVGSRLVTLSELKAACVLEHQNTIEAALASYNPNSYVARFLAIDWSGGGAKEDSLTAYVVLGLLPSGKIDVIYAMTRPHRIDHSADALEAMALFDTFHCHFLAHDYTGAGANREAMLATMEFDMSKIFPITLSTSHGRKHFMSYSPPTKSNVRSSYILDKARSLVFTCELTKCQYIRWPQYESCKQEIEHFLGLVEETKPTPRGPDLYLIGKAEGVPDDVAQAVNLGVCAIYESQQKWPDILKFVRGKVKQKNTKKALMQADPNLYR